MWYEPKTVTIEVWCASPYNPGEGNLQTFRLDPESAKLFLQTLDPEYLKGANELKTGGPSSDQLLSLLLHGG